MDTNELEQMGAEALALMVQQLNQERAELQGKVHALTDRIALLSSQVPAEVLAMHMPILTDTLRQLGIGAEPTPGTAPTSDPTPEPTPEG